MNDHVPDYFKNDRKSISNLIDEGENHVLDIGCGAGGLGASLKKAGKAREVYGIEIFEAAAIEAGKYLDGVLCKDLETITETDVKNAFGDRKYEYLIFGDVLEHLTNPWRVLQQFTRLLAPNGVVVVSLPNVRHWSVIYPLLKNGAWEYKKSGILDKTHLRFFTKSTAIELIDSAGLIPIRTSRTMGGRSDKISKITAGLLDEFLAEQYIFKCKLRKEIEYV